jgi:hypothetical protein
VPGSVVHAGASAQRADEFGRPGSSAGDHETTKKRRNTMRNVIYSMGPSLDGFIADRDRRRRAVVVPFRDAVQPDQLTAGAGHVRGSPDLWTNLDFLDRIYRKNSYFHDSLWKTPVIREEQGDHA